MNRIFAALLTLCCLFASSASATEVVVSEAWTRATAPGQTVAGIYFRIQSDRDATLVGVETEIAGVAELHFMSMEDGVMRMRAVPRVDLPARATVKFEPGGYHVMLFDLKRPLEPGDEAGLLLLVEDGNGDRTKIAVKAQVRNLDGSKAQHHHH